MNFNKVRSKWKFCIGATVRISAGIGLAYLLAASGASGGGEYIAPIFLPNDLVRIWLLSLKMIVLQQVLEFSDILYPS
ncbi:MAG: hypothetical protein WAM14_17170 [Candidatus Nitrosopolaris sp.]